MKISLFDFQQDAVEELQEKVSAARQFASTESPQAISFSAPTGSGKTVIMTSLFETMLVGGGNLPAQPDAVILWISDMPELNEQTRLKIERQSDKIKVRQLVTIDADFDEETLPDGNVFFINTQKLGTDKLLTRVGDGRKYSIWSTFSKTAKMKSDRFYVVIDEAHRGAGGSGAAEARTIMQRFVLGDEGLGLVKMPLVIGVSATPRRFLELLENAPHTVHKVLIPTDKVRASGLLKDRIVIHNPKDGSKPEMSLLSEAAHRWLDMTSGWTSYCVEESEDAVRPILVVQIENGTEAAVSRTHLPDVIDTLQTALGRPFHTDEIAHALNDVVELRVGTLKIRKVEASRINDDQAIGVVIFKQSLSTGWDCPRAEVMMSFRRAEDHTYIAQLLGRMVRTPLARRIERRAELNDVHLFLPHYDEEGVNSVINDLQNVEDVPPAETGSSRDLIILHRSADCEEAFSALDDLPTYRVGAVRSQPNLRRLIGLARGLSIDAIVANAWEDTKSEIVSWMGAELLKMHESGDLSTTLQSITKLTLTTTILDTTAGENATGTYEVEVSEIDLDRTFEAAGRALGGGLHMAYWQAHSERPGREVKAELIALQRSHPAMAELETKAEQVFNALYDQNKHAIGELKETRRQAYERLRLASTVPSEILWRLPETIDYKVPASSALYDKHLYVDDGGSFRAELSPWERDVIAEELKDATVVGWFRNPDRKPFSFEIPYRSGGVMKPFFPDFVVVRRDGAKLRTDVLEPHDPSLADNFEKAVGLGEFAERQGHLFGRIQLIRQRSSPSGGTYYSRLEVNSTVVQNKLRLVTSNVQLDAIFDEHGS